MQRWSPVVTAIVVLLGLGVFMAVNAVGGLVQAAETRQPTSSSTPPPATTQPTPPTTTTSPPETTTQPPATEENVFPDEVVYAGFAEDGKLAVAVAVSGDQVAAYLCDGVGVESWLTGTVSGGTVSAKSADGTTTLTAAAAGDGGERAGRIDGTVTIAGRALGFAIGVADPPAGLYRGEGDGTTIGWIVLPDGSQVGIATTGDRSRPAPRLDPAAGSVTVDGARIDAEKVTGAGF